MFAIAVTLLALQLHPPSLGGATTAGAVMHALAQQRRQFGFYALAFLVTGSLWIEHHQLLDPLIPTAAACHGSSWREILPDQPERSETTSYGDG